MVCSPCFDHRHPQEFVRGVPDDQGVRPNMRPEPADTYTVSAAPAYVRSKIEQGAFGTSQTLTFTAPTAGNRILLYCGPDKDSGAITTPTGWTTVGQQHTSGTGVSAALFTKVSDGTETSVTVRWTESGAGSLTLVELSGAGAVDQFGISTSNTSKTGRTSGTIQTAGEILDLSYQLAVAFAHTDSAASTNTASAHGWSNSFTEVDAMGMGASDWNDSSGAPSISVATKELTAIAVVSTEFTWTGDVADECMGMLVTVRPDFS